MINVAKDEAGNWALNTTYASSGESVTVATVTISAVDYESGQTLYVPAEASLDGSKASQVMKAFFQLLSASDLFSKLNRGNESIGSLSTAREDVFWWEHR